jgi:nucleoside-diphosphate-sugar epimerase
MRVICTGGSGFIGTHLADSLIMKETNFLNLDICEPYKHEHDKYWKRCDILDLDNLRDEFQKYKPTHVIHLAARASMEGESLDDFRENTDGSANVLKAVKASTSVKRIIVASTQHVRKPGSGQPLNDEDFDPLMLYGQSKIITEQLTRNADLDCIWTIIRPTNVWGPWHPHLVYGLWRLMKKGLYFHPSGKPVIRSYGYVRNVVWQIEKILNAPPALVDQKVYYVGEMPSSQLEWLNAFSKSLIGRDVRVIPSGLIKTLAGIGDILASIGVKFPMYTTRYKNLTTSNIVPIAATIETFGAPPYSLENGVQETVQWLEKEGFI